VAVASIEKSTVEAKILLNKVVYPRLLDVKPSIERKGLQTNNRQITIMLQIPTYTAGGRKKQIE
jgi:hypothetical protein